MRHAPQLNPGSVHKSHKENYINKEETSSPHPL